MFNNYYKKDNLFTNVQSFWKIKSAEIGILYSINQLFLNFFNIVFSGYLYHNVICKVYLISCSSISSELKELNTHTCILLHYFVMR